MFRVRGGRTAGPGAGAGCREGRTTWWPPRSRPLCRPFSGCNCVGRTGCSRRGPRPSGHRCDDEADRSPTVLGFAVARCRSGDTRAAPSHSRTTTCGAARFCTVCSSQSCCEVGDEDPPTGRRSDLRGRRSGAPPEQSIRRRPTDLSPQPELSRDPAYWAARYAELPGARAHSGSRALPKAVAVLSGRQWEARRAVTATAARLTGAPEEFPASTSSCDA